MTKLDDMDIIQTDAVRRDALWDSFLDEHVNTIQQQDSQGWCVPSTLWTSKSISNFPSNVDSRFFFGSELKAVLCKVRWQHNRRV